MFTLNIMSLSGLQNFLSLLYVFCGQLENRHSSLSLAVGD